MASRNYEMSDEKSSRTARLNVATGEISAPAGGGVREGVKTALKRTKSIRDIRNQAARIDRELERQRMAAYEVGGGGQKREGEIFRRQAKAAAAARDYIRNIESSKQYKDELDKTYNALQGIKAGDKASGKQFIYGLERLSTRKYEKAVYSKRKRQKTRKS